MSMTKQSLLTLEESLREASTPSEEVNSYSSVDIPRYILENRRGNNYFAHIAHDGEDDDLELGIPQLGSRNLFESSRRLLDRNSDNPFRSTGRFSSIRDRLFEFSRENRDPPFRLGSGLISRWRGGD